MRERIRRVLVLVVLAGTAAAPRSASAGDEKAVAGSYRLVKRVAADHSELTGPAVVGFMTFTKTHRTVIMKWNGPGGEPVSISYIATYTLANEKYCESAVYGVNSNLGAPGIIYDEPAAAPACTAAMRDASGLAFDVPNEQLRLRVTRDGIIATTPRWTDHWERVK